MAQYVLVNRRSGLYTDSAKIASRATVQATLGLLSSSEVVANHAPQDPLARQVVLLNADAAQVAAIRATLEADSILEPLVRRCLHRHVPIELQRAKPLGSTRAALSTAYTVRVSAGGSTLRNVDVMVYFRDPGGKVQSITVQTDGAGSVNVSVPNGFQVAFVEPIPYADFWIMLAEGPSSGSTVECAPIAKAGAEGAGWWHDVMGVDTSVQTRGAGIRVGVIDTGCGPHQNLSHVTLVGTFVDNTSDLNPGSGLDVAEHGTHTTGIIGARPSKPGDYAGIATGCDLFHARVFKGEGSDDGPSQADIINAVDSLSRDHQCDLINMSLGGGGMSRAEEDAILDAEQRGTLCICSAGNENGPIDYPAAYPECQAVSAVGKIGWPPAGTFSAGNRPREAARMGQNNLFLASFSCFGPALACAAPGVGIVSTVPDRDSFIGAYMEMDGTSMASPAACGALAVILSQDAIYQGLPRDITRAQRAKLLLAQHCRSFGLPVKFEGRGIPTI